MYTKNIVTVFEDCAVPGWNCIVSISPGFAKKRQVVTTKKLYWKEFVQSSRLVETNNLTGIFKVYKRLNRKQLFTCNLFLRRGDTVHTLKARIENWLSECCDAGLIEEKSADELICLLDKF